MRRGSSFSQFRTRELSRPARRREEGQDDDVAGSAEEQAQASMAAVGRGLGEAHPREMLRQVIVQAAKSVDAAPPDASALQTQSKALMGVVILFWALSCANVAGLLLALAVEKRHEVAVRLALGARRRHLALPIVIECILLALGGAVGGIALGRMGSHWLNGYLRGSTLGFSDFGTNVIAFDERAALFAAVVAFVAALLFGAVPLADSWKFDLTSVLRSGRERGSQGSGALRRSFVVVQIAFSVTLLLVAGLLGRTLLEIRQADPGFESEDLYVASFFMPRLPDQAPDETYRRIAERISGLPGVESVGQTLIPPLSGEMGNRFSEVTLDNEAITKTHQCFVGVDYHAALGVDLLAGRGFDHRDAMGSPFVAVVNRAFAENVVGPQGSYAEVLGRTFAPPWGALGFLRGGFARPCPGEDSARRIPRRRPDRHVAVQRADPAHRQRSAPERRPDLGGRRVGTALGDRGAGGHFELFRQLPTPGNRRADRVGCRRGESRTDGACRGCQDVGVRDSLRNHRGLAFRADAAKPALRIGRRRRSTDVHRGAHGHIRCLAGGSLDSRAPSGADRSRVGTARELIGSSSAWSSTIP